MQKGEKVTIIVSEPWDFSSSEGDNLLVCTILDINKSDKGDVFFAQTTTLFKIDNVPINYLILQVRDKDNKHFNIYHIEDKYMQECIKKDVCLEKAKFIIIGSLKDS